MATKAGIVHSNRALMRLVVACVVISVVVASCFSACFFTATEAPSPPNRRPIPPAAAPREKRSSKLQKEKDRLVREIKDIELKLAVALLEENTVAEEPEEIDPELFRLRRKYNIKAVPDAPPGPDSVSRREFNEMQPIREARGAVAQLALLRAATEDDDWNCDEACLASLAGESKLPLNELHELDRNLQADVRKVQQKLMELEFGQRLQFSADTRRRISWLNQFLKVVPSLREKVL